MKRTIFTALAVFMICICLGKTGVLADEETEGQAFAVIKYGSHIYTVIDIPENLLDREGFSRREFKMRDVPLTAWFENGDASDEFCQVYLQCGEDEPAFYQYDIREDTLQRIFEPSHSRQLLQSLDDQKAEQSFDIWWLRVEVCFCVLLLLILLFTSLRINRGRRMSKPISSTRALFLAQEVEASYGDKELKVYDFNEGRISGSVAEASLSSDNLAENIYVPVLTDIHYDKSTITIQWKPDPGVDGYNVYRKEVEGVWKQIGHLTDRTASAFTDNNLHREELYTYTVRAFRIFDDEEMQGDYNHQGLTELALSGHLPSMPELKSIELVPNGVQLQWWKIPNADFYNIYRHSEGEGWNLLTRLQNAGLTSYTDHSIAPDTVYYYTVRSGHRTPEKNYLSEYQKPGLRIRTGH